MISWDDFMEWGFWIEMASPACHEIVHMERFRQGELSMNDERFSRNENFLKLAWSRNDTSRED